MVNQKKAFRKGMIVMIITFMIFSTLSVFAATDSFTISGQLISNNDIKQGDIFIYKFFLYRKK